MRRLLKARELGLPEGDTSTLEASGMTHARPQDAVAARWLRADAADPPLRGEVRRALQRREDPRLPAPLHRRGSHRGGRHAGAHPARTRSSPPTASTGTRSRAASPHGGHGRDVRQGARAAAGARRIDAPVRSHAPLLRRQRHRRGRIADSGRARAGGQDAESTQVTACLFGDGAVAEGEFHESLNLAALWKLPVLFALREQPLRDGHRARAVQSQTDLASEGAELQHAAETVDGMDVVAVEAAARRASPTPCGTARAHASSSSDLSVSCPLDVRPGALPGQRGDRALEAAGPDRAFTARLAAGAALPRRSTLAALEAGGRRGDRRGGGFAEAGTLEPVAYLLEDVYAPTPDVPAP